jgi:hypothetical protein
LGGLTQLANSSGYEILISLNNFRLSAKLRTIISSLLAPVPLVKMKIDGNDVWRHDFDSGGDLLTLLVPEFTTIWEHHSYSIKFNSLVPDGKGGVVAAGRAIGAWVGQISDTGDPLWEKYLSHIEVTGLAMLDNGDVIISGDGWMGCMTDSGEPLWQRTLENNIVVTRIARFKWPEIILSGMLQRYEADEQAWTGLYDAYIANALVNGFPFKENTSTSVTRVLKTQSNPSDFAITSESITLSHLEVSVSIPDLLIQSLY